MQFQIDIRAEEVIALAEAGEGRGVDRVAAGAQIGRDARPDPAAEPGTVDEDKRGHR